MVGTAAGRSLQVAEARKPTAVGGRCCYCCCCCCFCWRPAPAALGHRRSRGAGHRTRGKRHALRHLSAGDAPRRTDARDAPGHLRLGIDLRPRRQGRASFSELLQRREVGGGLVPAGCVRAAELEPPVVARPASAVAWPPAAHWAATGESTPAVSSSAPTGRPVLDSRLSVEAAERQGFGQRAAQPHLQHQSPSSPPPSASHSASSPAFAPAQAPAPAPTFAAAPAVKVPEAESAAVPSTPLSAPTVGPAQAAPAAPKLPPESVDAAATTKCQSACHRGQSTSQRLQPIAGVPCPTEAADPMAVAPAVVAPTASVALPSLAPAASIAWLGTAVVALPATMLPKAGCPGEAIASALASLSPSPAAAASIATASAADTVACTGDVLEEMEDKDGNALLDIEALLAKLDEEELAEQRHSAPSRAKGASPEAARAHPAAGTGDEGSAVSFAEEMGGKYQAEIMAQVLQQRSS
mmetsp:Transcript_102852/g.331451  ORF Transcript_102852/g.331451 Transcript_102852/m.331451 type:complete len:468 (-) Transcript_102852:12-1415(-)